MTARETLEADLPIQRECTLPSPFPYPRPGRWAMLLLPLAYVAMGVCYFMALRSPTNGFWYPPIAFGKLMLLVYGPPALLPVLGSEMILMGVQYILLADMGFLAAGLVSLTTTSEGLLAWWLLRRRPINARLRQPRDLVRLLFYGGLIPNTAGALLGIALLYSFVDYGDRQIAPAALLWAAGDFVTTVTWMPAFVLWLGPILCGLCPRLPSARRLPELILILIVSAGTCVYVAVGMMKRPHLQEYNLKFLCFLPLIWAGIRFGLPGATASLAVASTTWALLYGNARPLDIVDLAITIEQVQVFNLALGIGGLMLGWAIDAERHARDVARDLSDQLQVNEARLHEAFDAAAAAQARAEHAGEVKYRLLSAVSHELRTPLTPMTLVLSELASRTDLPADVKESAEIALRQVQIEAGVVEELLEYADLMCGSEMRPSSIPWQRLIAPVRQAIDLEAQQDGVRVTWSVPESDFELFVDERKLARAALHTIRNAMRSCGPDGVVAIGVTVGDDMFRLACHVEPIRADTGLRDLEAFASTDRRLNGEGFGLGLTLAAARLIAERHGGSLLITESSDKRSATYTLLARWTGPSTRE